MILDRGFCSVYCVTNDPGNESTSTLKFQSWYGELNFETAPSKPSDDQQDVQITARVRINQCREISNQDVVVLTSELPPPAEALQLEVIRAYNGIDDDNGQPITDLTLRKAQTRYDLSEVP